LPELERLIRRVRWAYLIPVAAGMSIRYRLWARRRSFREVSGSNRYRSLAQRRGPMPATVVRAVEIATARPPLKTTCLVRSLVAARLLRRYGHSAKVVIGVPPGGTSTDTWTAHAWLEVRPAQPFGDYEEIVRLSP
jgi:hypothetical protein